MRRALACLPVVSILALAGCEQHQPPGAAAPAAETSPDSDVAAAAPPQQSTPQPVPDVPHIYMALQPDLTGATSVIFAIDEARNNTPADDPAIRITPENGRCNPQELRRYNFPGDSGARPTFGPEEAVEGLKAEDLPNFMAMAVTSEMLRAGLVAQPDESQPQNVCTRKLWEQLIVNESTS